MSGLSVGKKFFLLGLLIIVMLAGLHYSAGTIDQLTPVGSAVRDVMAPVQRVFMIAGREISEFVSSPARLIKLSKRNQALEKRNRELESQLLQYKEVCEENKQLKEQLKFKNKLEFNNTGEFSKPEVAAVTGRNYDNWFGSITINKGENEGIRKDMTVITPAGLVGRVLRVSRHTAEVLLITDPRSGVSSLVQETRAHGMLEGVQGGQEQLQMINIPTDLAPKPGDRIITSGFGSFFPKGIPVGTVRQVHKEQTGLFKMAVVDPYVDFNRLEEVLVITSFTPDEPESTGR